jgi:hypothetical protein
MKYKIEILRVLRDFADRMIPQPTLMYQVQLSGSAIPPSKAEFDESLKGLDNDGMVVGITNDLDGICRWQITDKGRAALVKLGQ